MTSIPQDRRYSSSHEWASRVDGLLVIGITAHAVEELGDLVFVDLPETGARVNAGESFGEIESVKAVSELNSPVSGTVAEVNKDLEDNLDTLGESPYEDGWLIKIEPSDPTEYDELLTHDGYRKLLEKSE